MLRSSSSPSDNRAARRRSSQREMRGLLEEFAATSSTHEVDEDVDRCQFCDREIPPELRRSVDEHDSSCLWRRTREWLARHPVG